VSGRADVPRVEAREDPALAARVVRRVPLVYEGGADPALDRPAHVRAASGLARVGDRVAVVQDDANFLALVDPATGRAEAVPLPPGEGGARLFGAARGTKHLKLDLEACLALPPELTPDGAPTVLALGSGSTRRREQALLATLPAGGRSHARIVPAPGLYALLRAASAFSGSEMNVEGAVLVGDRVRLFGRGNGAARGDARALNATCDVDAARLVAYLRGRGAPPAPGAIVQYALGDLDGAPLGFTDAALAGRRVLYTAAAEASPDAVQDGEVTGSVLGIIEGPEARWTPLADADGRPLAGLKAEGILAATPDGSRLWVVNDADDPDTPSELLEVVIGEA
jgi:hypothetical protein